MEYERFRAWLRIKLRQKRGAPTALAKKLGRERNWAGRVAKGSTDIPFSAALDIAEYFKTSMGDVLKPGVPPGFEAISLPSELATAMRDPVIVAAVEALQRVGKDYRLQSAQGLRMVAGLPLIALSSVPTDETTSAGDTTKGPKKRR
jgi:hypothetical protein